MSYIVDTSVIHGVGVIAKSPYPSGSVVGMWMSEIKTNARRVLWQDENMTEPWYEIGDLGRYCNHQINSNVNVEHNGKNVQLISKGISIDDEITVDYRKATEISGFQIDISNFIEL